MSNPLETPGRARTAVLAQGTPSPRKIQEWNLGIAQASPEHAQQREQAQKIIRDLLYDDSQSIATREASAFIIDETMRSAMRNNNLEFEFVDGLAVVHDNLADFVVQDAQELEHQELHQILSGNPTGSVGQELQDGGDKWTLALHEQGLEQGDGSEEAPVFTGARDLKDAPQPLSITIDLTDETTVSRLQDVQKTLYTQFTNLVFSGQQNRRKLCMKLHPWAVINWVNFFTGMVLGPKGLGKINSVITAAHRANIHGDTYDDINRARQLARDEGISRQERILFDTVAHVINTDMPQSNAYTKFVNNCACAILYTKFLTLVNEAQTNPTGEVARSIQRQRGQGKKVRDRVVAVCARNMSWTVAKFNDLLDRHSALSSCGLAFSGGFLVLVDDQMKSILKNNVKSAVPALISIVKQVFPELAVVCTHIYNNVCRPLMHPDPAISGKFAGKTIDVSKGETDMLGRISAILE